MSNNEYLSSFGVVRQYGRGEGRDELYEASAKPALGAHNCIEVVVDSKGPTPNFDGKYHRDGKGIRQIVLALRVVRCQLIECFL